MYSFVGFFTRQMMRTDAHLYFILRTHICHFRGWRRKRSRCAWLAAPTVNTLHFRGKKQNVFLSLGGNVTVLVIRAFKLAALPKHCQTLCERSEILTALSPLIVAAWEGEEEKKEKCKS